MDAHAHANVDNLYRREPYWRDKRLTPAQLQIHDVSLETRRAQPSEHLDINEIPVSALIAHQLAFPGKEQVETSLRDLPALQSLVNESERQQLDRLDDSFSWMRSLRLRDDDDVRKVRWIHVSSTFPEYLQGVFAGLTDWKTNAKPSLNSLRRIGQSVKSNERSSNHGKFFSPFLRSLAPRSNSLGEDVPFLMSVPFLDWTIFPGPPPPLRFQIDERETYRATRLQRHPMRSLLRYHYRLEDTSDRERSQVYSRHRPWLTDREIDLKVRRIYGHYPTSLAVDELWILVIDSRHIVTFSSNQTWKSRWPAMQLSARIADHSFLGLQKVRHEEQSQSYSAHLHAVVCLHGALGLVHRNFSEGLMLPCAERFASHLGHLQFRLYRLPSTKLVMDLLELQDELSIILNVTKAQERTLMDLQDLIHSRPVTANRRVSVFSRRDSSADSRSSVLSLDKVLPVTGVLDRLRVELDDLTELRTNTNELVSRTVQLVNIRLEDHGQAILIFTIVTVIFLPLSFLSSFFGMNTADIRTMDQGQWIFWAVAAALTVSVVGISSFLAFYGSTLVEKFLIWRDTTSFAFGWQKRLGSRGREEVARQGERREGFTVFDVAASEPVLGTGSW